MHLNEIARVVGHDIDPVANHTVSAGAIPLEVLNMPRRVDGLEPLGDPEQLGPVGAGEEKEGMPALRDG
jgi:hypothetical protein